MIPLIKGFKATSIWKAFILQAVAATIIIFIAVTLKTKYDKYTDIRGEQVFSSITWKSVVFTLLFTFAAALFAYATMFWIFGFGGGMLVQTIQVKP
jgi:ABC-type spermidine/putrescine transport system permease subunit I